MKMKLQFPAIYLTILSLFLVVGCTDPSILLLEGVWEVSVIKSGETTFNYPVSVKTALEVENPDLDMDFDIDDDEEDEDLLYKMYIECSDGRMRFYSAIEQYDPGEEATKAQWTAVESFLGKESVTYNSETDIKYTQLALDVILKDAAEDGSDLPCSFEVSDGTIVFTSDDGYFSFTATEADESVLKGAVEDTDTL